MRTEYFISIDAFCANHNIEISFVRSLKQSGFIETTTIDNADFFDSDQLRRLEKYLLLYYELDINHEGIEIIKHLMLRINNLQKEIIALKNRLHS